MLKILRQVTIAAVNYLKNLMVLHVFPQKNCEIKVNQFQTFLTYMKLELPGDLSEIFQIGSYRPTARFIEHKAKMKLW